MTAVLVSAKVSVFYSMIIKTSPKSSERSYLALYWSENYKT